MRPALVVCLAAVLYAVVASPAPAARRPPVIPAVAQYIEVLPTSGGEVAPSGHARTPLPKRVAHELSNSSEDKLLTAVATSAAYGAPQHRVVKKHAAAKPRAQRPKPRLKPRPAVSKPALTASVDAVGSGRDVVVWLIVVMLATAGVGAGAAAFGRRAQAG
jgi:hypothetical protein